MIGNRIEAELKYMWKHSDVFEPSIILLHPADVFLLNEERKEILFLNPNSVIDMNKLTYRGIKIYRTEDIEQGKVIIK